jgi:hypothetical protein
VCGRTRVPGFMKEAKLDVAQVLADPPTPRVQGAGCVDKFWELIYIFLKRKSQSDGTIPK